jgi:hypothetical protein
MRPFMVEEEIELVTVTVNISTTGDGQSSTEPSRKAL